MKSLKEVLLYFANNPNGKIICVEDNRIYGGAKGDVVKIGQAMLSKDSAFRQVGFIWEKNCYTVPLDIFDEDIVWEEYTTLKPELEPWELSALQKAVENGYNWIARDWNGVLYLYKDKPIKDSPDSDTWSINDSAESFVEDDYVPAFELPQFFFPQITFESGAVDMREMVKELDTEEILNKILNKGE